LSESDFLRGNKGRHQPTRKKSRISKAYSAGNKRGTGEKSFLRGKEPLLVKSCLKTQKKGGKKSTKRFAGYLKRRKSEPENNLSMEPSYLQVRKSPGGGEKQAVRRSSAGTGDSTWRRDCWVVMGRVHVRGSRKGETRMKGGEVLLCP